MEHDKKCSKKKYYIIPMSFGYSIADFFTKITSKKTPILDIRETFELEETGTIENAIHLPMADISEERLLKHGITKETEYFLLCRSGQRTEYAACILREAGYQNVWSINGGITEWIILGKPVIPFTKNI